MPLCSTAIIVDKAKKGSMVSVRPGGVDSAATGGHFGDRKEFWQVVGRKEGRIVNTWREGLWSEGFVDIDGGGGRDEVVVGDYNEGNYKEAVGSEVEGAGSEVEGRK
ncbi:unnamed protein product [Linum trigynum]|uniref:Uncharacterized protein n=1 Tax=Linum trigynum TaxID=586398 RepID=A0AAV2DEE1_9ROSI